MDGPTCHRARRRFWFPTEPGLGVGVTAASEQEARQLTEAALARRLARGGAPAAITDVVPDIDVRTPDPVHVLPNVGPAVVRGVWFPRLNL